MPLAERLRTSLAALGVGPHDRLVVAASGGVDSTVLLRSLVELGQPVVAVHVDHGLRPESAEDGAFVVALAAELGVPGASVRVEVGEGNVQAAAREARYAALVEAARRYDARFVATAHTATDQAETVLMALVRGAGLRGLAGMPSHRMLDHGVDLIRPLLQVSRGEITAEAGERAWTWREDPSNATGAYRRNRVRQSVLPVLRDEGGPGLDRRIAATADNARAALTLVQTQVEAMGDRLSLVVLRGLPTDPRRALLAEAIARYAPCATRSRALVARLDALLDADVGTRVESGGVVAWRERDALRLARGAERTGVLAVEPLAAVPRQFGGDPFSEVVDADRVGDVEVRSWRDGDRIRPLGMDGSQLVSDLLRGRGVPRADRADVPVVVADGEVLWVVGHRLAARIAVTSETRRAERWTWHPDADEG